MPSQEMRYLMRNVEELEDQFQGCYVAISKKRVVATGHTPSEVFQKVEQIKAPRPLIAYIPREGEESLRL